MNKSFFDSAIVVLTVAAAVMSISGCAIIAVGGAAAGTVAYVKGDLEASVDASLTKTIAAVDSTIYYLRFLKIGQEQVKPIGQKNDAIRITIRDPDDKKVTIKLAPIDPDITHISIRVGAFGDEARSQAILSEIKRSLVW